MNHATNTLSRLSCALALLLVCWCGLSQAQIPHKLSYQGYLTSPSGAAINNVSLQLTFKLYSVASGGTALYSETQSVNVINGIFNALIGSGTPLTLAFDQPYFVGISAGGDPEMTPRQPLAASPYAIRAASSESLAATALVAASNLPATQLLPTVACLTNQIPQWNGSAWVCATASSGAGSGTVTNIATGAGLTGGPISTTGTISIATGGVTAAMLAANSVTQAKLSPLSGGTAGKVLGTDGSNLVWQTAPSPSPGITFVTPSIVAAGRTVTVNVIGEATNFNGSTTFSAGAGIFVSNVIAVSRGALEVEVITNPTAALGPRDITVTTGTQVLTMPGGLRVVAPLTAAVKTGALIQGSSALVLAQLAVGRTFTPAVAGGVLSVGNATFTPSAGLSIVSNRWLAPNTAELLVEVSPFANIAIVANLVANYTDGTVADDAFGFGTVAFNTVIPVTVGTPNPGELIGAREAGLFSIAVTNAPSTLQFSVSPEPGGLLAPRVRLYRAGISTPIADVNATSGTATFATNGTYVFSVVDRNGGGGATGYGYTFVLTP